MTCQNLKITEEIFNELYPDLIGHYDFFNEPVPAGISNADFERRYLSNKLWRLNNCYSVIDKWGNLVPFKMNYSQHVAYSSSRQHPRLVILKSRQQGISTFWLISYFDDCLVCPNMTIGLMAQGKEEASTLLERTKLLWDNLNDSVKSFFNVQLDKDNTTEFSFKNNSKIFIRVSFRSATLSRLHVSEFGKIANAYPKRAKEVKTGTLQALAKGNTGVIESTAEGHNEFKLMWDNAVLCEAAGRLAPKDFKPVFLPWWKDPDCLSDIDQLVTDVAAAYFAKLETAIDQQLTKEQKNFWIIQYRELGDDIYQEYPGTPAEAFQASRNGTYYAHLYNEFVVGQNRLVNDLYEPNLPVDAYFDIGVDDYMVVGLVQWRDGMWRLIDELFDEGKAIQWYVQQIVDRGYNIRWWKFPHDIAKRDPAAMGKNGEAKSAIETVEDYIRDNRLPGLVDSVGKTSLLSGIEATRHMFQYLMIDTRCNYLVQCALNYTKEYDEKLQVWKQTPVHNIYSHGADVLRYIAVDTVESNIAHLTKDERHQARRPQRSGGYSL